MPVKEHANERQLLARVLKIWARLGSSEPGPDGKLGKAVARFPTLTEEQINRLVGVQDLAVNVGVSTGVIRGPFCSHGTPFQPLATFRLWGGQRLNVSLELAALHLDARGEVAADGWRFETAEHGAQDPHRWPHVQRITQWGQTRHLANPTTDVADLPPDMPQDETVGDRRVNTRKPAFPLRCTTAAGLALAMVASIQGVPYVREKFINGDKELKRGILAEEQDLVLP